MTDKWQNDVRVRYDVPADVSYISPKQRTEAQRAQDDLLDKAADHAEQALEHANKALDWLIVTAQAAQSKHRNLPVYIQQLVEEIAELKRIRR